MIVCIIIAKYLLIKLLNMYTLFSSVYSIYYLYIPVLLQ